MWTFIHHRLPTKVRLLKFKPQDNLKCVFCNTKDEDEHHLFFESPTVCSLWTEVREWWPLPPAQATIEGSIKSLLKSKGDKQYKQLTYAIFSAVMYTIWAARNAALFKDHYTIVQRMF